VSRRRDYTFLGSIWWLLILILATSPSELWVKLLLILAMIGGTILVLKRPPRQ
jgi:hypothetical protein